MAKISDKKIIKKKIVIKKKISEIKKTIDKPQKKWLLVFLAIANILWFIAVLIVNYLATSLPIGWMTTGELSDLYPNLFTPAGLTFSIWGLIYFALTGFVIWQILDLYKKKSMEITKKIWIWFLLSCLANIWWIFAWQYKLVALSVVIMLLFLIILIVISNKIWIWKKLWTLLDKLFIQIPFSLYLWWLSVATIANISAWLVNIWWSNFGMSDVFWTIIVIIVATLLALISLYKKYNIVFALVVVRAFIGIIIKRVSVDPIYAQSIIWVLWICIAVISLSIWLVFDKWRKN